jgi:hypothetical protein
MIEQTYFSTWFEWFQNFCKEKNVDLRMTSVVCAWIVEWCMNGRENSGACNKIGAILASDF